MYQQIPMNRAKIVVSVGVMTSLISYLYTIITGEYNGDFSKMDCNLPPSVLLIVLLFTVIPYLYLFYEYRRSYKIARKHLSYNPYTYSKYNTKTILILSWVTLLGLAYFYIIGYGVLGEGRAVMSSGILSILRSIIYKFLSYSPWVITYFICAQNKHLFAITALLFLIVNILHHSISGFYTLFLILLYKYGSISKLFKKYLFLIIISAVSILPLGISMIYGIRDQLRTGEKHEYENPTEIIYDRLIGRMSSFSNNAYILESAPLLLAANSGLPDYFLVYDALGIVGVRRSGFISTGVYIRTDLSGLTNEDYSTMAGFGGVIVLSITKSLSILMLNLLLIFIGIRTIFALTLKIGLSDAPGVALFCTIGFALSADVSELSSKILGLLCMWLIICFTAKRHHKKISDI